MVGISILMTSKLNMHYWPGVVIVSDDKTRIGDKMIAAKLTEKSLELNLSFNGLIERYIRRGLFSDDYSDPPHLTREELMELSRREVEKDKKRGIPPKKHDFSVFIGLLNKSDD